MYLSPFRAGLPRLGQKHQQGRRNRKCSKVGGARAPFSSFLSMQRHRANVKFRQGWRGICLLCPPPPRLLRPWTPTVSGAAAGGPIFLKKAINVSTPASTSTCWLDLAPRIYLPICIVSVVLQLCAHSRALSSWRRRPSPPPLPTERRSGGGQGLRPCSKACIRIFSLGLSIAASSVSLQSIGSEVST